MTDQERSVFLTPECNTLWLLTPRLLLLYDRAVIDERDLNGILNPRKDTLFAAMKARMAEKLVEWQLLTPIDYGAILDSASRDAIRRLASASIARSVPNAETPFEGSRFMELAIHAHEEYAAYLENSILACPSRDGPDLESYVRRLQDIDDRITRIQRMDVDDDFLSRVQWTLERVAAKAFAGLVVGARSGASRLFDTSEYAPFVEQVQVGEIMPTLVPDVDHAPLATVVAALSKKRLPDVSLVDDHRLFSQLRCADEFQRVREALRHLELVFGELLHEDAHDALPYKKILVEVERADRELNERLQEAQQLTETKYLPAEMLAGLAAGFFGPIVDRSKRAAQAFNRDELLAELGSASDLSGDVFFLLEVWSRHGILADERYHDLMQSREARPIWGDEDGEELPWYERPEADADSR